MSDKIKLEPVTASVWVERAFIVCVNPANPDDKMEFGSFVEMNDKLFALKAEVKRLDALCKQLGKHHSDISCENITLRKAGDAMDNAISEIDPQRLERHRFMQMTDSEHISVIKWRTAKDPNYNRA